MKTRILTILAAALIGFATSAIAQEDETVSDDVDLALWCAAAYSAVTQIEGTTADEVAAADAAATAAFTQAKIAMDADGIDPTEYDRLLNYYVELAVDDLTDPVAELRYSDEECSALIAN